MNLSEKIFRLRKQNGMSQEELAERLNVSWQSVSRWENGSALPDAANLSQLTASETRYSANIPLSVLSKTLE